MGDYVFRNFITPGMQVKTLVSYAIKKLQLKRFAILYPDENYGKTFMNLFWDEVIALGGKVVGAEPYNINHTDFADPIKKLVGLNYDIPEDLKYPGEQVADKEIDHNEKEKMTGPTIGKPSAMTNLKLKPRKKKRNKTLKIRKRSLILMSFSFPMRQIKRG